MVNNLGKVIQLVNGRNRIQTWLSDSKVRAFKGYVHCLPPKGGTGKKRDIHGPVMIISSLFFLGGVGGSVGGMG